MNVKEIEMLSDVKIIECLMQTDSGCKLGSAAVRIIEGTFVNAFTTGTTLRHIPEDCIMGKPVKQSFGLTGWGRLDCKVVYQVGSMFIPEHILNEVMK
jgi:hypothetical protein